MQHNLTCVIVSSRAQESKQKPSNKSLQDSLITTFCLLLYSLELVYWFSTTYSFTSGLPSEDLVNDFAFSFFFFLIKKRKEKGDKPLNCKYMLA
jgi:hypothetical protein